MGAVILPTGTPEERERAISRAAAAIGRGRLVVIPTDTVYGVAADAFDPTAVDDLLAAKGRGRQMPPPVLIGSASTVDALVDALPAFARALIEQFWPGPLTLVARQQESLQWDLGDTHGTVAVRMPDDELARAVLERTGPLAVSSANRTGELPATTASAAQEMLGEHVAVVVDGGPSQGTEVSTIVDVTGTNARVLRRGAIGLAELERVLSPLDCTVVDEG